ncbi:MULTISPECIES: ABC transporter permease [Clostridium]|uniref:ABC transporter permease n=1 Tax=Clostridium TaxID=1485 RepID=UPI0008263F2C|nr:MULTISPECIES: ABC transporter permease [Clostridium]PJI08121.1 ABC transporter permease [Clostridium sp. CT7]
MRILHIAYYTIKQKFKYGIVMMIIFPLILIGGIGNSLKEVYKGGNIYSEHVDVLAFNKNDYVSITNYLKSNSAFKDKIIIKKVNSEKSGTNNLKSGKIDAYICMRDRNDIKLYLKEKIDDSSDSIVKSFVYAYKASLVEGKHTYNIPAQKIYVNNVKGSAIEYYSVTMLVMIILYGAEFGIKAAANDMEKSIEPRVKSLPIKTCTVIIGRIVGLVAIMVIDCLAIIIAAKFIYRMDWGNNYALVLFVIVFFSTFAVALGMCFQLIFRNNRVSSYIVQVLVPIFTFLAGGYMDRRFMGDELRKISVISPSYAAQNLIFHSVYGGEANVQGFCLEIIILDVVFLGIILILARRSSN